MVSAYPVPGQRPGGVSSPSSLWAAQGLFVCCHGNGEVEAALRGLQGPGLLSGCSSHSWSSRYSFLHSWATVPRTRCPGLKTLFQGQSRKYLCLCPQFLHTPPCVLALAVPRAPCVPSAQRPFPEADPCLGHSRAGALEPSSFSMWSAPPHAPRGHSEPALHPECCVQSSGPTGCNCPLQ